MKKVSKIETEVTLTVKDVEDLIKESVKKVLGVEVDNVNFIINTEYDPTDLYGRYGPTYVFGGVTCKEIVIN